MSLYDEVKKDLEAIQLQEKVIEEAEKRLKQLNQYLTDKLVHIPGKYRALLKKCGLNREYDELYFIDNGWYRQPKVYITRDNELLFRYGSRSYEDSDETLILPISVLKNEEKYFARKEKELLEDKEKSKKDEIERLRKRLNELE